MRVRASVCVRACGVCACVCACVCVCVCVYIPLNILLVYVHMLFIFVSITLHCKQMVHSYKMVRFLLLGSVV